jgi:hypothetical protein
MATNINSISPARIGQAAKVKRRQVLALLLTAVPAAVATLYNGPGQADNQVQSPPTTNPPDNPALAALLDGLAIMRLELDNLDVALYQYLTGDINAAQWLKIYEEAPVNLKFAALQAVGRRSGTDGDIIASARAAGNQEA